MCGYWSEAPFIWGMRVETSFAWGEMTGLGEIGIGILFKDNSSIGEVVGVDGMFWAATLDDPVPAPVDPTARSAFGLIATLDPANTATLAESEDKSALEQQLDALFVDTDEYIYVAEITGEFDSIKYLSVGADVTAELKALVREGKSEFAEDTLGTDPKTVKNVGATIVVVRAPTALPLMFEVPHHMHFLSSDQRHLVT